MRRRTRVTEAYIAKLGQTLTPRDHELIASLDRVRVATASQLRRLHVAEGTTAAQVRITQRRLRALTDLRVVTLLDRQVGGFGGGSRDGVYALDTAGQHLASACGPAGGARLRRPWTPGSSFLLHQLAVAELYVRLRELERQGVLDELLAFDAEPAAWRRFTGPGGALSWLKPDAFSRVGRADWEFASFIEVDRATASVPTVMRKLAVYRRYFQTGREQERFGLFPRVVLLAPTEARKEALVAALAAQPADAWELFRVALYDDASSVLTGEAA